ncbi:MAG: radical SAM protein [Acidobacteriota bacterium]
MTHDPTQAAPAAAIAGTSYSDFDAPLFVAWQLNSACNLSCLHCCEEVGDHLFSDELTPEEVTFFLKQIVDLRIPYVAISGGEPLLHPRFFEISSFLRAHGTSLKVETNGLLIDRQVANRIGALGFRSVQVSVDGSTPQTFRMMRPNGDWEKVVEACDHLVAAGVTTEIVFVPSKFNIHETGDVIEMAYRMGTYGFYTGKIMRIGRAARNWDLLCPTETEYEKFFDVLKEKQTKYDGKMKIYYYPYDVVEELRYRLDCPAASLLVIPNGKVKLIGPLPFVCADLRRHSLSEAWQRYKRAWREPEVVTFAKRVVEDPRLLGEANKWVELYPGC